MLFIYLPLSALGLISCADQRIFVVCTRACVCVDGRGSPPGQTDSRRNSENFFEVGVVFLVLNLFCWGDQGFFQRKLSLNYNLARFQSSKHFHWTWDFLGGGEGGGPDPLHRKSQAQWKIWSSGILANHSFFAHPPGSACLFTYKHTDSRVHWVHLRQHWFYSIMTSLTHCVSARVSSTQWKYDNFGVGQFCVASKRCVLRRRKTVNLAANLLQYNKQTQKSAKLVTIVKTVKIVSEYHQEISQSQQQTNSWRREEEPHNNHETLGR